MNTTPRPPAAREAVALMRGAFVDMSRLATRGGADEHEISDLHGRFFDGHELLKDALDAVTAPVSTPD